MVDLEAVVGDFVVWIQSENLAIGVHRLLCLSHFFGFGILFFFTELCQRSINFGWLTSPTYPPTRAFCIERVVMYAFSRRIVGWAMATHLQSELVVSALNMALYQRRPEDVIHHSDQGAQYTSIAYHAPIAYEKLHLSQAWNTSPKYSTEAG